MSPDEKNVICVPEPHQWLMLLGSQKFRFNLIHENACIWCCKLCSDSRSRNLLFNFSVKFKIIILEHKFSQLNRIVSRDLFRLFFLGVLLMPSNQAHADTKIQSYSIPSDKYRVFWKVSYLFNLS